MFGPYGSVVATPGARSFMVAGLVARLPISTLGLGIVLLIAGRTGSYGLAGAISAAGLLAEAVAGPVLGRLVDRFGQAVVLVPATVVFGAAVVALVVTVETGAPRWTTFACSVVAGMSLPPVGSMIRARWTYALQAGPMLHTAFSLEAVNDELVFMVGPVLVTVLATQVHEAAGLLTVVVLAVVSGLWLASQRATEPPSSHATSTARTAPLPRWWLASMVLVGASLGALFGATEVITVAFAQEQGHRPAAGLLLATWATGSMLAGLITGAVMWASSALQRFRVGALALFLTMVPLPFIGSLPVMFCTLFVAGFAISPTLVASVTLLEENVPLARLTEGMTWFTTGIALGIAPGAAAAGRLIDDHGASPAYVVPIVAGLVAVTVAWLMRPPAGGRSGNTVPSDTRIAS